MLSPSSALAGASKCTSGTKPGSFSVALSLSLTVPEGDDGRTCGFLRRGLVGTFPLKMGTRIGLRS